MPNVPAARTLLGDVRGHTQYLGRFPRNKESAAFEHLVAQACACTLHLPYYSADDQTIPDQFFVKWRGSVSQVTRAPRGADAIVHARGYHVLVEPTLKTGITQWSNEFDPCCRHYDDFVRSPQVEPGNVYVLMIPTRVHPTTWNSVSQSGLNFVALPLEHLATMLETSILALTMMDGQLRQLLDRLVRDCREALSLNDFLALAGESVAQWQKAVLRAEKGTFLAVRSYMAVHRLADGRAPVLVSSGDLFRRMRYDPVAKRYMNLLGRRLESRELEQSLCGEHLGFRADVALREPLFCPVPLSDYAVRSARLVQVLEVVG